MRPSSLHPVYTTGIVVFGTKVQKKDKYGTPIRGQYETSEAYRDWYRKLGITAQDTYYANADDASITRKIAIRGDVDIDVKWVAELGGKSYTVYRVFYSYKNNETEISLAEVNQ